MISTLKKKLNKKGFTLAELLIVVAIIAVLVAISIPVFTSQLEKAREATDAANIRNAISDVTIQYLSVDDPTAGSGYSITVKLVQKTDGWSTSPTFNNSQGQAISGSDGTPKAGGTATVTMSNAGVLSIAYSTT